MSEPRFFELPASVSLKTVAAWADAEIYRGDETLEISEVAPLEDAGAGALVFFDNTAYLNQLEATGAAACLVGKRHREKVPEGVAVLVCSEAYRSWAMVLAHLYPAAMTPKDPLISGVSERAVVDPAAILEENITVEPGAVIGADVEIGSGTVIRANAVIGRGVKIGRDCVIGANCTVQHTVLGNRVCLHPGVCSGQDGFGYAMGPQGHLKVPQVGRVIIQDDVEIGANTTIDRGANRDTVIGEGTKIDNQVQIGHNVVVGRHCVLVSQVGLSGSCTLEDFVAIGGKTGVRGHITIGMGAQVAAVSVVNDDLAAGGRYGGTPAKPVKQWFREVAAVRKLAERGDES
ncbi:UDP-3-O-(3-hydroxymyristoyl)glucosamine N-acyltransferase [Roseibium album]|uniref:UDP-3-O-acylglucosamine N-acyltransferase n=1 Tax=Roseibium album TaxID=311410 RepID=A0A0M6ZL59_9HYPH|nr:UDP-3-O-(3-hydroxymyristoyl)glucosamine N-acyltransferase [Roseibium album]CTQ62876.1 UDP-3-O-acylglucosamine N-acyltransferase [Roseibium album]CTQ68952.1 UDP-3-O-acylglucosamine N-acyltransferase [Roseibium album]CTQ80460.1 UDP-3-O-acylglucosamine N-acyltransferase [Roseibium album]